jgi:hypothetical protein
MVQVCDFLNTAILHRNEAMAGDAPGGQEHVQESHHTGSPAQAVQRRQRKVLLFAHHRSVMNALSRFLEGKMEGFRGSAVRYVRIDGETPDEMRAALRRDFQNDGGIEVCLPVTPMSTSQEQPASTSTERCSHISHSCVSITLQGHADLGLRCAAPRQALRHTGDLSELQMWHNSHNYR